MRYQVPPNDVFQAESATEFLRDTFESLRKRGGQTYSLRAIARRAGIPSVASLSMALTGSRKLSPEIAEKCADFLELKGPRRKFFHLLVEKDRATEPKQRESLEEQCFFLRTVATQRPLDWKQYVVLSNWYSVATFVLVGLKGFVADANRISRRLGRGIRPKQIEQALQHLIEVGLVEHDEKGWRHSEGSVLKTAEDVQSLSIQRYHRGMLSLAHAALSLPISDREFSGLTFSVPRARMPELKERIRQFRDEIDSFSTTNGDEDVYQLSLQLFPLTLRKVEGEE